ncbi:MAG: hypothetical protein JNM17_26385 [Archangium sp.]|nr:hypothetical protein [Archangium sp.]
MKATFDDGREAQFQDMMKGLAQLQAKYRGVRAELLAKVRDELMRLKPTSSMKGNGAPPTPPTHSMLPSCRMCGRGMKVAEDGNYICPTGHIRAAS